MNDAIEAYITRDPADVQAILRAVRALTVAAMPGACEFIYHDALGYGPTNEGFKRICYIAPQPKGYVNLGFFFGARLPDPRRLLVGEGARLRHIKIKSVDEAHNPAVGSLVRAAWDNAPTDLAALHARRQRSRSEAMRTLSGKAANE